MMHFHVRNHILNVKEFIANDALELKGMSCLTTAKGLEGIISSLRLPSYQC